MTDKDTFQKDVVEALKTAGFNELFQQNQHKEFIQMIAATYFSNQLQFDGILEYLADIVDSEIQRKKIAEIIRDIKTPKIQKKPQPAKQDKTDKVQKKPQKKLKQDFPPKPKQQKKQELKTPQDQEQNPIKGQEQQLPPISSKRGLKHQLQSSGKVKCRFFPFCKNTSQGCEFFHPTQKCQYFPSCRFGDNCLYVHEACKFKENCTKLNCPFAHPGKRGPPNALQMFMKSMMMGKNQMMPGGNKMIKKKRPNHNQGGKEESQQDQQ